ncbi:hypothetical protein ACNFJ7_13070 [Sphingomonas sp. HT-1]|uniref:hypothetical protein n=1 Tax=unclassified Sphingomonas TaxID=196159 RepID=UPI0002E29F59|nr:MULTISPECIES: hypothetical protein [unclassified Sphingomonas]KTF69081.1 hypothetical protein ATB93_10475 [Sphingomonas sp. WG]
MGRFVAVVAVFGLAADAPPLELAMAPVRATVKATAATLRIDPAAPTIPVFNPEFASRAGFEAGLFGTRAAIGPVKVPGKSAVVRLDFERGEFKRRVTWFAAPVVTGADGIIGPGGLPEPRILFRLRPDSPEDEIARFAMADWGYNGLGIEIAVAGQVMHVAFAPYRAESLATAGAGAALASAQGGHFDAAPHGMPIELGVERPVRHLALDQPLAIGPLRLAGMLVRTSDFGSTSTIPEGDVDPNEIVVTGKAKGKPTLTLAIGAELLSRCASILFDKAAKQVTLRCR